MPHNHEVEFMHIPQIQLGYRLMNVTVYGKIKKSWGLHVSWMAHNNIMQEEEKHTQRTCCTMYKYIKPNLAQIYSTQYANQAGSVHNYCTICLQFISASCIN